MPLLASGPLAALLLQPWLLLLIVRFSMQPTIRR